MELNFGESSKPIGTDVAKAHNHTFKYGSRVFVTLSTAQLTEEHDHNIGVNLDGTRRNYRTSRGSGLQHTHYIDAVRVPNDVAELLKEGQETSE